MFSIDDEEADKESDNETEDEDEEENEKDEKEDEPSNFEIIGQSLGLTRNHRQ